MSQIKVTQSKTKDLQILIHDAIIIHAFNNFDFEFCLYLMILNHKAKYKVQLLILFELIEILRNKELQLKNKSTTNANSVKKT